MNQILLDLYHHLPPMFRNIAASAHGYYLQSWRYGPDTEQLIADAYAREHWTADQWKEYQENRVAFVLNRAATKVPYYREMWASRRRKGDESSWDYLENWPILEKETLRHNARAFVADDRDIRQLSREQTSGTTGKPLELWWSRETARTWYALFEARWRRWNGVNRDDRWAILGGRLVAPVWQTEPPFWVWNRGMKQLYLSSYHLAPRYLSAYLDALYRYEVSYIYGYTSSVYSLAREILRSNEVIAPKIKVVITNAEPLYQHQRQIIMEAFRCRVCETYGMSEVVAAAGECEYGQLHLWPEVGYVEINHRDKNESSDNASDLISTGLLNIDMPLIRYRVGDRARLPSDNKPCDCGRHLQRLGSVEGRQDDVIYTTDGRVIGRLDPVFKASLHIREAQIVQESLHHIRVLCVPDSNFNPDDRNTIIERLRERIGSVDITLEEVASIPRTANGKFRAVVCKLPVEDRFQSRRAAP